MVDETEEDTVDIFAARDEFEDVDENVVSPHRHPQMSVALSRPNVPVKSPMNLRPWGLRIISSRKS